MTPVELIRLILRDAGVNGVGQTPNFEDNNDVLLHLNLMLGQWSSQRWLVYHLVDTSVTVTGAASYTVGTGGDFNITRPDRIDNAFFRSTSNPLQPVDYALEPFKSREDWNAVGVKNIGTWPQRYFYDSGYPLGTFYPYPIPTSGIGELHIATKAVLAQFPDLTTAINFPPEYLNALLWNGCSIARVMYGMEPDRKIEGLARASLEVIRASNTQIPSMRFPSIVSGRGLRYNIFSDGAR